MPDFARIGRTTRRIGISQAVSLRIIPTTSVNGTPAATQFKVFPDIELDGLRHEGTLPTESNAPLETYKNPPEWSGKLQSCAIDAVIAITRLTGTIICRSDAISFTDWNLLRRSEATYRMFAQVPWAELKSHDGMKIRDILMEALREDSLFNNERHPWKPGKWADTTDLFPLLYRNVRTFSYHFVSKAWSCCDRVAKIRNEKQVKQQSNHTISLSTVEKYHTRSCFPSMTIAQIFQAHSFPPPNSTELNRDDYGNPRPYPSTPCGAGAACRRLPHHQRLVLDRLPPFLLVSLAGDSQISHNKDRKYFEDMNITYQQLASDSTISTYVVRYSVACVVYLSGGHFFVRGRTDQGLGDEFVHVDAALKHPTERVSYTESWTSSLLDSDNVHNIVYRIQGTPYL